MLDHYLAELYRVLRRGGRLFVLLPAFDILWTFENTSEVPRGLLQSESQQGEVQMTLYIRPHGDDKNDGSSAEKAVRSAQQAAKIALRNQDWQINIDVFDLDRIFRELDQSRGFAGSQVLT
jgi:hypothetical protein